MLNSPYNKPPVTPPSVHPRVMLTAQDLPRIRHNIEAPENAKIVSLWRSLCDRPLSEFLPVFASGEYSQLGYMVLEAKALRALLENDLAEARDLAAQIVTLVAVYDADGALMHARYGGHVIFLASLVYDWFYPLLTDEEKHTVIHHCERIAQSTFEIGYPPVRQNPLSGHGNEAQLLRDLLAFSIAVYDERPDIYDFCAGRLFDEFLPAYKELFQAEYHPQTPAYATYRYCYAMWAGLLFQVMSGQKIFAPCMENLADSFLYLLRPDGAFLVQGDDWTQRKLPAFFTHYATQPMFFAYAYTGRTRYEQVFRQYLLPEQLLPVRFDHLFYPGYDAYGEATFTPNAVLIFLGLNASQETAPLPVSRYFGSPVGLSIWNDHKTTAVLLKIGEYWGANHDHLDTGCFQIYHKGSLAIDSGVYDDYFGEIQMNYNTRTSAHNCVTISDPEKLGTYSPWLASKTRNTKAVYDGGVLYPNIGHAPDSLRMWLDEYKFADIVSHREDENGIALCGDLTYSYRDRVDKYVRTMNFDATAGTYGILTVTDDIVAKDARYIKTFHLHCMEAPEINGNTVTICHGGGKLVCTVVEPADAVITSVGGKGLEFTVGDLVFRERDIAKTKASGTVVYKETPTGLEHGWGQVRITPSTQEKATRFVVKMEIFDR